MPTNTQNNALSFLANFAQSGVAGLQQRQQQRRQQQEQERANLDSQIKNATAALKHIEVLYGKDSPAADRQRLQLTRMMVEPDILGELGAPPQRAPIPGRASADIPVTPGADFSRQLPALPLQRNAGRVSVEGLAAGQAGQVASGQRNIERQRAFQQSRVRALGSVAGRAPEVLRKAGVKQVEAKQKSDISFLKRQFWTLARTRSKNLYPSGNNLFDRLLSQLVPELAGTEAPNLSWDNNVHGQALLDIITALGKAGNPVPQEVLSTLKLDELSGRQPSVGAAISSPQDLNNAPVFQSAAALSTAVPTQVTGSQVYENAQGEKIRWDGTKWVPVR